MFWKSVTLDNYIPFTHSGIKHVHIDFSRCANAVAILGGNGSGKSSLLRALTPYPSVRTDFGPGGRIVKVLSHNGKIYELTSDFNNSGSPHSFKMDDVELNLSGTTETQKDLVEEHFGITKLIDDLLIGDFSICDMSKAERRSLFSSLYPGDLSFVIDYYKKVCSSIRACGNQLKLLKSREATLRSSLIDADERVRLDKFRENALNFVNTIDKDILRIEENIKIYSANNVESELTPERLAGLKNEIINLKKKILRNYMLYGIRQKVKDNPSPASIEELGDDHAVVASVTRERINVLTSQLGSIRDELNSFIACREMSKSLDEKDNLEQRYKQLQSDLSKVSALIGFEAPVTIDPAYVDAVESELIPYLKTWCEEIHGTGVKLNIQEVVLDLKSKLDNAHMALNGTIGEELSKISSEIVSVRDRLTKLQSRPYPKDCHQVCPLRSAVKDNIDSAEKILNELAERRKQLIDQRTKLEDFISKGSPVLEIQNKLHQSLAVAVHAIRKMCVEHIAFGGENPVSAVNTNCFEIVNRLIRACEKTRLVARRNLICDEMKSIQDTLQALASTKQIQVSAEIVESTIRDREEKLNQGIKEIEHLEELCKKESLLSHEIDETARDFSEMLGLQREITTYVKSETIKSWIEFYRGVADDLTKAKNDINEELFTISKVLQEQNKYSSILEDEILPTINNVSTAKANYEAVADGLSPVNGLPCIYLIRFINRLIAKANKIIGKVWFYNLELMYLDEESDLDFNIKVMFRNSTEAKDISLLSNGQKAMVDLAMRLALCIERGFLEEFAVRLDEIDGPLTEEHRTKLVCMLSDLMDKGVIKQMLLVNHYAMQTGMHQCSCIALNTEGIIVPDDVNAYAEIS